MTELVTWLALLGVAAILGATLLYIREWGPGLVVRRIHCPEKQAEARVTFLQKEGDFGSMKVEDVVDRKSTRLNSSHIQKSRMPSSA